MALNAGCDLNCGCTFPMLVPAYRAGLVTEEAIDTALTRLLRTRFKLGMFDPPSLDPYAKLGREVIDCEKHRVLARKAAIKSIVLLKNDNNLLPLDDSTKKILLIGPAAANIHTLLANYHGLNSRLVTILEGLTEKLSDKYNIAMDYHQGCKMYDENNQNGWTVGMAESADVVIAVFGLDNAMEGEEGDVIASNSKGDRDSIELPEHQVNYLRALKERGKPVVLILTGGSPIAVPVDIADAILFAWYPGEEGGTAIADILFGDAVPSGKLPLTFPVSTKQLPPYEDYSMSSGLGRTYRYMKEEPLYPFGFGLSYATFRFDTLSLSATSISAGGCIKAKVTLTNTGKVDAENVVQLYVAKENRSANDPVCSLRAFSRVAIPAGKSAAAEFELPSSAFESVLESGESALVPGAYIVTAADSAPLAISVKRGAAKPVSAKINVV
jgi:beta-glucosidase